MNTKTRLDALENATRSGAETVFVLEYEDAPEPAEYRVVPGERYTVKVPLYRQTDGTLSERPPDPGPSKPD